MAFWLGRTLQTPQLEVTAASVEVSMLRMPEMRPRSARGAAVFPHTLALGGVHIFQGARRATRFTLRGASFLG